jgi:hypothetical protein
MISPKTFLQFINEANALNDLRSDNTKLPIVSSSKETQKPLMNTSIPTQQDVDTTNSSVQSYTPRSSPTINPTWAKANPKLAAVQAEKDRIRGTSESDNPMIDAEMRSRMPMPKTMQSPTFAKDLGSSSGNQSLLNNPNVSKTATPIPTLPTQKIPTAPTLPTQKIPTAPTLPTAPALNPKQQELYTQAYTNRNNPFAKGRIQSEFSKLTPEEQKAFKEYAKTQNHDWGNLI